jgi:hypothetical protein
VYKDSSSTAYLLLYVDDIVLTASLIELLHSLGVFIQNSLTDLGDLHHFLGISVTRTFDVLFLSQAAVCFGPASARRYERVPLHLDAR